ncbi:response regulator [Radiobacillus kanasensis]|uniref:response regulator transcription factor n=1 Tax=Radiobacillus kanasensis TaxID=2844358 RepID=UPI001E29FB74|nr:response regulator [Radiobacillus kanasensis]UFT98389.1 response regulator [Radiobacillus kanasensis]
MGSKQLFKAIIVEDEALIRRNLVRKINKWNTNFTVVGEAMNGQEALKLIEEEIPQIVITDIRMPIMDGLQLAQNIYFAFPTVKIIILSGHDEFEYARKAINYRVEDYLLKPINDEKFSSLLARIEIDLNKDLDSLAHAATSMVDKASQKEIVEIIKLFIKENYCNDLTLNDIATHLNFSVDYLGKLFKKHTGMSPIKYITNLRMNEAKRLLATNLDMDIQTVGRLVGYKDPHYFSRAFKNNTGFYPTEFQKQEVKK